MWVEQLREPRQFSNIVEDNGGVRIEIIQVGARKGKSVVPYDLDVVTDLMEAARNPKIDVLVELMSDVI